MLRDLVLDTNVLVHASNPSVGYYGSSLLLLSLLQDSATAICVDEGYSPESALNTSVIGHEYGEHLNHGMVAFAVIAALAAGDRLKQVSRSVPVAVARKINQRVPKPHDRAFVRVAHNSEDRTLASHDFSDFRVRVRKELRNELGVHILTAAEVASRM